MALGKEEMADGRVPKVSVRVFPAPLLSHVEQVLSSSCWGICLLCPFQANDSRGQLGGEGQS